MFLLLREKGGFELIELFFELLLDGVFDGLIGLFNS